MCVCVTVCSIFVRDRTCSFAHKHTSVCVRASVFVSERACTKMNGECEQMSEEDGKISHNTWNSINGSGLGWFSACIVEVRTTTRQVRNETSPAKRAPTNEWHQRHRARNTNTRRDRRLIENKFNFDWKHYMVAILLPPSESLMGAIWPVGNKSLTFLLGTQHLANGWIMWPRPNGIPNFYWICTMNWILSL